MKVCIESSEGGFVVSELPESGMEQMSEGPQLPEESGQSYASLDEALDAARTMLSGGDEGMEPDKPMMEGEQAFVDGFKNVRGGA